MSGGAISTTSTSFGVMPSCASILRRKRKSTANRLGIAIRLPARSRKRRYGESVRTMMTAPERWPSETILTGIFLSARSMTSGASMYAAWMRPAISDSLISGQPLYLLYSYSNFGWPAARAAFDLSRDEHATGSVRLQVTGSPPTCRTEPLFSLLEQDRPYSGSAAATDPSRNCRRVSGRAARVSAKVSFKGSRSRSDGEKAGARCHAGVIGKRRIVAGAQDAATRRERAGVRRRRYSTAG